MNNAFMNVIAPCYIINYVKTCGHKTWFLSHLAPAIKDLAETATLEGVRLALEHESLGLQLFWSMLKVSAVPSQVHLSWNEVRN